MVSKLLSNDMEVQFNLKEYSGRHPDEEVIAMRLCEDNFVCNKLYQVHEADVAELVLY